MAEDEIKLDEHEEGSGGIGRKLVKVALVIILLAVQLSVSYLVVGHLVLPRQAPSVESEEALQDVAATDEEPREMGEVYMLDDIVVNPAHTQGLRYLITTMALELGGADAETIEKKEPLIRDQVITLLSGKRVEELVDMSQREHIREELLAAINGQLGRAKVRKLYFVKYVLQ